MINLGRMKSAATDGLPILSYSHAKGFQNLAQFQYPIGQHVIVDSRISFGLGNLNCVSGMFEVAHAWGINKKNPFYII